MLENEKKYVTINKRRGSLHTEDFFLYEKYVKTEIILLQGRLIFVKAINKRKNADFCSKSAFLTRNMVLSIFGVDYFSEIFFARLVLPTLARTM